MMTDLHPTISISEDKKKTWSKQAKVLLRELWKVDGNTKCMDCGANEPCWASVNLGAMLCLECSGIHRALGVHLSFVRSTELDQWSKSQIASMNMGGNAHLQSFLAQQGVDLDSPPGDKYSTPAAELWRLQLKAKVKGEEVPSELTPQQLRDAMSSSPKPAKEVSTSPAQWTLDTDAPNCELCQLKFSVTRRRHHCRRCGKCVCAACAPKKNTRPIPEWKLFQPVRHCSSCYRSPAVFTKDRIGTLN